MWLQLPVLDVTLTRLQTLLIHQQHSDGWECISLELPAVTNLTSFKQSPARAQSHHGRFSSKTGGTMFVVETAVALSAKVIFETIGATAGFAKEGIGLFDSLRERKKKDEGILSRSLKQSGNATPEAQKAVHEMYEALAGSDALCTPHRETANSGAASGRPRISMWTCRSIRRCVHGARCPIHRPTTLRCAAMDIFWPALFRAPVLRSHMDPPFPGNHTPPPPIWTSSNTFRTSRSTVCCPK